MPTEEQLRRANIENHEAARLERLRASKSFQPTRPAPPVPVIRDSYFVDGDFSRFSDTDNDSPSIGRAFNFTRGASKRHARNANQSLNRVRPLPSMEILDHISQDQMRTELKPSLSRSVTLAAARALFASDTLKTPSTPPCRYPLSDVAEGAHPEDIEKYDNCKRRGMITPSKLMHENRKKSRQRSFLRSGTLRIPKDNKTDR